ncbi:Coronin-7 [Geranomyces variabilis]|uniref:Coronin n=1 Tax=Geranomyces variabilis TaxID=109894 RepID=A0AAD5XQL1_9FUNG|nr:Coronin-7 [Geranomyces variabilis]
MKRFQNVSKYRNAVLAASKREDWYSFPPGPTQLSVAGDNVPITASRENIAFRIGTAGTAVGVRSLKDVGRSTIDGTRQLHVGALVTALRFSSFANESGDVLAGGGDDGVVKLWTISKEAPAENENNALSWSQSCHERRIEDLAFNPAASGVLATCGGNRLSVWDLTAKEAIWTVSNTGEVVQSINWKEDGSLLISANKDNVLRVFDPRKSADAIVSGAAHGGTKATRAIWLANTAFVFTTGFSQRRDREYGLWDTRNLSSPVVLEKLDTSPGILTPLYDSDTSMMYLCGKGDSRVTFLEIQSQDAASATAGVLSYNPPAVISGAALIPKSACNVMSCEVARILTVSSDGSAIIPVSVTIPRKSHADFHADLFPETASSTPEMDSAHWRGGKNTPPKRVSLNPKAAVAPSPAGDQIAYKAAVPGVASGSFHRTLPVQSVASSVQTAEAKASPPQSPRAAPKFALPKTSAYRFVVGKVQSAFEDLKGLSTAVPSESSALQANNSFLAFPMTGPGGRLAIWPVATTGRLPVALPGIVCGSDLLDFHLNPFETTSLLTATDDGKVKLWVVSENGQPEREPKISFTAHTNRTSIVMFHPTIRDLILTSSPEQGAPTVKLWNLRTQTTIHTLSHPDIVLGCAFSPDGEYLATVSRDKLIRVFSIRDGQELQKGASHDGIKACRVLWLKDGKLLTIGFGRGSQREIRIYDPDNLLNALHTKTIDTSPSLLMPYYDEDTSVLYLSGRGETSTLMFEITEEGPQYLTRFDSPGAQQGMAFLPKLECDVRAIEIAKGYRISSSAVERVSFTVPRLRREFFQDDIFPPTRDVTRPALDIDDWLSGSKVELMRVDLAPIGMTPLSKAPVEVKEQPRAQVLEREQTEAEIKAAGLKLMFEQAKKEADEVLPQDEAEGVDSDEWDD